MKLVYGIQRTKNTRKKATNEIIQKNCHLPAICMLQVGWWIQAMVVRTVCCSSCSSCCSCRCCGIQTKWRWGWWGWSWRVLSTKSMARIFRPIWLESTASDFRSRGRYWSSSTAASTGSSIQWNLICWTRWSTTWCHRLLMRRTTTLLTDRYFTILMWNMNKNIKFNDWKLHNSTQHK